MVSIKTNVEKWLKQALVAVVLGGWIGVLLLGHGAPVGAALNNLPGSDAPTLTTKEMRDLVGGGLTGNYPEDVKKVVESLRHALSMATDDPNKKAAQTDAKYKINAFAARYRRDPYQGMESFTTLRTALNTLATYYNGTARRSVPQKVKDRVIYELNKAETALAEGL